MKEYFNKDERDRHIILLILTEIISEFKDNNALTEFEKDELEHAEEHLRAFNNSVCDRFGAAYKRKIKGTLEVNTIKVVSKCASTKALSYYDVRDLEKQVEDMIAFHCCDCDKCDYKSCPTYDMAVTCGVEARNENGCPYKW
jgi:hypothetical protein